MKVISVANCVAALDQDQNYTNNNNNNHIINTMIANSGTTVDLGQHPTSILKSVEIQNMLRPSCEVLGDFDQTERSTDSPPLHCTADDRSANTLPTSPTAIIPAATIATIKPAATNHRLPGISELLPSLYLCGAGVAIPAFIETLGITCVVNAAPELPDTPLPDSRPLYYQVPVLDRGDINLMQYFDEVADMLEQVRQSGGRSMVHCVAGVSRSASLCIAYLMKYAAMRLREAFEHVRRVRPQIRPNVGFFRQLIEYERLLHGCASVQFIFVESLAQEIPDVYEPEYRAMELFYQKHRHVKRR